MKRLNTHGASVIALALAAGLTALPAQAQQAAPSPQATQLDEIVVTAQRREQRLQDVPIAVTAFSAETLERTASTGIQDVAGKAPGVTLTQFNIGEPQIYIRGVGTSSDSAASDPSIGVSIDEVSIGRAGASSLGFLDIERVEILRGPQGTLYGRNASGGALNIYTNRPRFEDSGLITGRYGSFNEYGVDGHINRQLSDEVAGRLAFLYKTNDGYATDVTSGGDLHGGTQWGVRGQLLYQAERLRVLAGLDYSKDDMDGQARIPVLSSATPPPFAAIVNQLRDGLSIRESYSSASNYQNRENWGLTLRTDYDAEAFTFTSLTSYRDNEYGWRDNLGGLTFPAFPLLVDNIAEESANQFSQEFRLSSNETSPFAWVAGVYYFNENIDRNERCLVGTALPIAPPNFGGDTSFIQDAENISYAAFGQATFDFADIWELTLGARWTHDKRDVRQIALDNDIGGSLPPGIPLGPTGSPYDVNASATFEEPTWRVALAVEPIPDVRFYASYDRGYKAGSFVSGAQTAIQASTPIRSELLDNYELGAKTTLMDGRLRLNAAAFRLDYKDLQVYELLGLNLVTSNAQAEVKGFEIEAAAALTANITIGGSYTSLDAHYTSDAVSGADVLPYDGNRLPRSPDSQFTLYVDTEWYAWGGTLAARADYQWTDEFFFDPSNNPEVLVPSYGLASAYLSWESPDGLKIAVYGKNLTDEAYQTHIIKNVGIGFSTFGPPRAYGIALSRRF